MSKKYPPKVESDLERHARKHKLKLMDYRGVTHETFDEAKELVCEAARRIAESYTPKLQAVDVATSPMVDLMVVIGSRRDTPPVLCDECSELE